MQKGIKNAGMKFRRFLYRIGKYSMFVITVITCYNLTTHLLELRREKIRKEQNKKAALVSLTVIASVSSFIVGIAAILKYVKFLKKGYLLDLFDTDAYDVIEPEEESPAESYIKSELNTVEDSSGHEKLFAKQIPLDEDACEEDYNN
jgi:hypothetical protein